MYITNAILHDVHTTVTPVSAQLQSLMQHRKAAIVTANVAVKPEKREINI